jgi:PadR family transcriptional regulator, regulatory protein PadR
LNGSASSRNSRFAHSQGGVARTAAWAGILLRIGQISGNALFIGQGALYPGLFRLVRQGLLKANWGTSENNRRAKFYELTVVGGKRLQEETDSWNRLAGAIAGALPPQPEEA